MKYVSIAALSALSVLALSACSSNTVKDTLGLERAPPDEFRVVSRPPLYVPPQFTLRPPANSDTSPNQLAADKKAQAILNGTDTPDTNGSLKPDTAITPVSATDTATATPAKTPKKNAKASAPARDTGTSVASTGAESQFLKDAGADKADPHVRDVLTEEKYAAQEQKDDKAWWDLSSDDKKDPLVDAKKENQRIQTNEDTGQPVTTGNTPEIKQKDHGILNGILGTD